MVKTVAFQATYSGSNPDRCILRNLGSLSTPITGESDKKTVFSYAGVPERSNGSDSKSDGLVPSQVRFLSPASVRASPYPPGVLYQSPFFRQNFYQPTKHS